MRCCDIDCLGKDDEEFSMSVTSHSLLVATVVRSEGRRFLRTKTIMTTLLMITARSVMIEEGAPNMYATTNPQQPLQPLGTSPIQHIIEYRISEYQFPISPIRAVRGKKIAPLRCIHISYFRMK